MIRGRLLSCRPFFHSSLVAPMPSHHPSARKVLTGLTGLLLIGLALALGSGVTRLDWVALLRDPLGQANAGQALILWQLRLPRVLLAGLIGAALAMTGAAMQGLFRNPLADPSIIGVTSGASLGASVVIAGLSMFGVGAGTLGLSGLIAGAFLGGLITSALVYRMASAGGGTSVVMMLLVGLAVAALAGAVNSALAFVVDNEALRRISLWQMGGLTGASWQQVQMAAVLMLPALLLLPRQALALDALLLGESEARHLGVDVTAVQRQLIVLVVLAVAAAVALAGVIAFIGLIVPHMLRLWLGPQHRLLLPASGLAGALLLVLADVLARSLLPPAELPLGILTALLGAPLFLSLLRQRQLFLPA